MRKGFCLVLLLLFAAALLSRPTPALAQPVASCATSATEPHPLRPYPGEICGPEATRTIDQTDKPYCAFRPWAARDEAYMRNREDCTFFQDWSDQFPCILRLFNGTYTIDLTQYELPLVSVTRNGSDLTFFNRAQQHLADYLEGRVYYDAVAEPDPTQIEDRPEIWNRAGVYRKLSPLIPSNEGDVPQNARKIGIIQSAGGSLHNYIVGYISGGQPSDWGVGTPIRLSDFIGHYPPDYADYACDGILNSRARLDCIAGFMDDLQAWQATIYGQLWPYVPMFTREDAIGYVQINPEPLQWFDPTSPAGLAEISLANPVSIPHLPRLNAVSSRLQEMLSSNLLEEILEEETDPFMGTACPAGPWPADFVSNPTDYYYNACTRGELCNLGEQFYSIGDYILDTLLEFRAKHGLADPPNPKIIPHPYYDDYWDYVCQLEECDSSFPSSGDPERDVQNFWCSAAGDDEVSAVRSCPDLGYTLPYCDLEDCQGSSSSPYCDVGAIRQCDEPGMFNWWYECSTGGWDLIYPFPFYPGGSSGACRAEPQRYIPKMRCEGTPGDLNSGTWVQVPDDTPDAGRCVDVNENLKIAFTPGYVRTYTPYLRNIWENTVNQTQAVFTPFRTRLSAGIFDWPGESFLSYDFTHDYAESGAPPATSPADAAKVYFRYLGFIHCSKENLLQKLASLLNEDDPYIFYDARCNEEIW